MTHVQTDGRRVANGAAAVGETPAVYYSKPNLAFVFENGITSGMFFRPSSVSLNADVSSQWSGEPINFGKEAARVSAADYQYINKDCQGMTK